jgi:hypothetical protein
MRTQIFADKAQPNYVTVIADDLITGERVTTQYFAPACGGYVRINDHRNYPQVCDGLQSTGSTLSWGGGLPFANLIRREFRAGRAAEKRILVGDYA